jgi:hypothetical protein
MDRGFGGIGIVIGLAVAGVVIAAPVYGIAWSNTHNTVTCTVETKDRTAKAKGGSDQRLYTDCGVLAVADDWINGQWNSSDLYAQIDEGETYIFETVGWRNGLLSAFPNVVRAEAD